MEKTANRYLVHGARFTTCLSALMLTACPGESDKAPASSPVLDVLPKNVSRALQEKFDIEIGAERFEGGGKIYVSEPASGVVSLPTSADVVAEDEYDTEIDGETDLTISFPIRDQSFQVFYVCLSVGMTEVTVSGSAKNGLAPLQTVKIECYDDGDPPDGGAGGSGGDSGPGGGGQGGSGGGGTNDGGPGTGGATPEGGTEGGSPTETQLVSTVAGGETVALAPASWSVRPALIVAGDGIAIHDRETGEPLGTEPWSHLFGSFPVVSPTLGSLLLSYGENGVTRNPVFTDDDWGLGITFTQSRVQVFDMFGIPNASDTDDYDSWVEVSQSRVGLYRADTLSEDTRYRVTMADLGDSTPVGAVARGSDPPNYLIITLDGKLVHGSYPSDNGLLNFFAVYGELRRVGCFDDFCAISDYGDKRLVLLEWSDPTQPPEVLDTIDLPGRPVGLDVKRVGNDFVVHTAGLEASEPEVHRITWGPMTQTTMKSLRLPDECVDPVDVKVTSTTRGFALCNGSPYGVFFNLDF